MRRVESATIAVDVALTEALARRDPAQHDGDDGGVRQQRDAERVAVQPRAPTPRHAPLHRATLLLGER